MPQQTYWCDGVVGETEEVGHILMRVVLETVSTVHRIMLELCPFFVVQN